MRLERRRRGLHGSRRRCCCCCCCRCGGDGRMLLLLLLLLLLHGRHGHMRRCGGVGASRRWRLGGRGEVCIWLHQGAAEPLQLIAASLLLGVPAGNQRELVGPAAAGDVASWQRQLAEQWRQRRLKLAGACRREAVAEVSAAPHASSTQHLSMRLDVCLQPGSGGKRAG